LSQQIITANITEIFDFQKIPIKMFSKNQSYNCQ